MTLAYKTPNMGSYRAGADLSAKQYCFVKAGTVVGEVVACAAASDVPLGVLMNAPESGEPADVALPGGGAKVKLASSSGTPGAGSFLRIDAAGNGVKAVDIDAQVVAQVDAIGSAAANSDIVPVIVMHPTKAPGLISAEAGSMTAKSPETDAEAAFLTVSIGGTEYEIPAYAKA